MERILVGCPQNIAEAVEAVVVLVGLWTWESDQLPLVLSTWHLLRDSSVDRGTLFW